MTLEVRPGKLADLWGVPTVQGDTEGGTGGKTWYEAGHGRQAVGASGVGEFCQSAASAAGIQHEGIRTSIYHYHVPHGTGF